MRLANALTVVIHGNLEELSMSVARRIAQISANAIEKRGLFRVVLAGGDTPRRCYEILREMPLDWLHVHVYFGDERCLPYGDKQRNDSMAKKTLLDHVPIPSANVHAIPAEQGARISAMEYAACLDHVLPFDLVLLGMGEDGHTASLFPENPGTELKEIVVPIFNAPKFPSERVSLGLGTLNSAREKIFLVAGATKRVALQRIAQGIALPAARIMGAEWHIDHAAFPTGILTNN